MYEISGEGEICSEVLKLSLWHGQEHGKMCTSTPRIVKGGQLHSEQSLKILL